MAKNMNEKTIAEDTRKINKVFNGAIVVDQIDHPGYADHDQISEIYRYDYTKAPGEDPYVPVGGGGAEVGKPSSLVQNYRPQISRIRFTFSKKRLHIKSHLPVYITGKETLAIIYQR